MSRRWPARPSARPCTYPALYVIAHVADSIVDAHPAATISAACSVMLMSAVLSRVFDDGDQVRKSPQDRGKVGRVGVPAVPSLVGAVHGVSSRMGASSGHL